ncbi:NUDIX domain-containing protein [Pseudoduganella umbonata]|uniref:8-oxo-dGTP pyrophosphatase MutT (NUDIX family) n=1 Tax=Pseudoduganella umbonata TaxID=864828 RepID=A0A4P8HKF3_9BURK|nr:NUDIX hydrolase [Pseudoduganella umbonata]MBB3219236.1 8-oxo-dGTP pyrophosphatase MutT (NUDIX family) [Pseudoduganella umbonata]QCP09356.1 NUDIX hydrolase [Pseudoduganella umbonata]
MPQLHPCPDDDGNPVVIRMPSTPTPLAAWQEPARLATVTPGGELPGAIHGIPLAPWASAPDSAAGWADLADRALLDEPPFVLPAGMRAAAGAVIVEDDGRVWLVAPSNRFGGYTATFPKGRADSGDSLHCTAIRETFEEAGLQVRLVAFLTDCRRTLTYTRYYIARRIGGTPAAMGWETQAVHLVPIGQLDRVATHHNDFPVIKAAREWIDAHLR